VGFFKVLAEVDTDLFSPSVSLLQIHVRPVKYYTKITENFLIYFDQIQSRCHPCAGTFLSSSKI
jgi:hypothetical protein